MTRGRSYFLTLALALLATAGAHAAAVTVDCDGGPADFATLQAAVNSLTPADGNSITVTGTCIESVSINNFESLNIGSTSGATVQGTVVSAIDIFNSPFVFITGVSIDASAVEYGVFVSDSILLMRDGDISGATEIGVLALTDAEVGLGGQDPADAVTINNNLAGAFASRAELDLLGHVTIEDNTEDALLYSGAEGVSIGRDVGNTIRNNGLGVTAVDGGQVRFSGLHTIDNNGPYGVFALRPERVVFSGYPGSSSGPPFYGATISNHDVWGVVAVSTRLDFFGPAENLVHTVSGNGTAPYAKDAGVWIGRQAEARLRNITIDGNYGHGVHGTLGAYVNLLNTSINNNDRHGVRLSWNSTGDLGSFSILDGTTIGPNVTASGNGKKAIKCAKGSVLAGNRTGISPIVCDDPDGGGSPFAAGSDEDGTSAGLGVQLDIERRVDARREAAESRARKLAAAARGNAELKR